MSFVVFFRAANVGGHQVFRPSVLAKQMAKFDVVNIGAAGTFVVRGKITEVALRTELLRRLPFKPELMICPARTVIALMESDPFRDAPPDEKAVLRSVTVMQKPALKLPRLPLEQPAGSKWEVKVIGVTGRFAWSLRRRMERSKFHPNEVVEKHFGTPATTRNLNTISAICEVLGRTV
ncbi:MAG: hypothetical protein EXS18_00605 [Verrucomicrobiae bacterium]|nr:hypothetical protein [Verrucomicrobiae bacterium]